MYEPERSTKLTNTKPPTKIIVAGENSGLLAANVQLKTSNSKIHDDLYFNH